LVLNQEKNSIKTWWKMLTQHQQTNYHRLTIIVYTVYNLWKERCRWVFDNKAQSTQQLLQIIREDLKQLQQAHENAQEYN
jgi:hypothetical protein